MGLAAAAAVALLLGTAPAAWGVALEKFGVQQFGGASQPYAPQAQAAPQPAAVSDAEIDAAANRAVAVFNQQTPEVQQEWRARYETLRDQAIQGGRVDEAKYYLRLIELTAPPQENP